jgi:hypothetical protein
MFIAKPACEAPVMAILGRTDARYFHAVELSIRLPWFIVNTILSHGKERYIWSLCCAWEQDLAALCDPASGREIVSIQQVVPTDAVMGGWAMRQIVKVWRAPDSNGFKYVVLQDDHGSEFSGEFGAAPPEGLGERDLLFSLEPSKRRSGVRRKNPNEPLGHDLPLHAQAAGLKSKVSAAELAKFMGGIDAKGVAKLEASGELFHVADESSPNKRRYPLYQVWPGIPRQIVLHVLEILRADGGTASPHFFFAFQDPDLGWLTPIEVLLGALLVDRELHRDAPMLLTASAEDRHDFVLAAARNYANAAAA